MGGVDIRTLRSFIIPVMSLVLADQIIKLIISFSFMEYDFNIIGNFIRFKPVLNINLSWGGNYITVLSNPLFAILINILALFIMITGYLLYKQKRFETSIPVKILMVLGLSGCMCSLIDKLFWGGSLDFIQIPSLFTFDLKDCYLSTSLIVFVSLGMIYGKEISVKEYISFCCSGFRR